MNTIQAFRVLAALDEWAPEKCRSLARRHCWLVRPLDSEGQQEKASPMATDEDILSRIKRLVDEERALAGGDSAERRKHLEEQLDQCWDLLRQRQAQREVGGDPDEAHPRPVQEVESYLQ